MAALPSMAHNHQSAGERDEVRTKSGARVDHSRSGLTVGPALSGTAGRGSAARPPGSVSTRVTCQPKSGREPESRALGGSEASAVLELDEPSISTLWQFFQLLDRWDRGGPGGA